MWARLFSLIIFCFFSPSILCGSTSLKPTLTVYIPMRDGFEFATDLYYPPDSDIGNHWPCILIRIPAGRLAEPWHQLADLSRYGYVVAIQDTRSALDKDGKTMPYISDGWGEHQDGFDTVEWLSKSSFTNGRIGTAGCSAAGITQLMLAPTAPKGLKCQYIGQAPGSLYHHAIFPGGQLHKHQVESWLGYYAPHPSVLAYALSQPYYNEFWRSLDTIAVAGNTQSPAFYYTGWYDTFLQGTIDSFAARQRNGKEQSKEMQKLVIGPWNHFWPLDLSLGDFELPEYAKYPPIDISEKRWFDYHLKDISNGIENVPAVTYYVMGPFDGSSSSGNKWRSAKKWPLDAKEVSYYLHADGSLDEKIEKSERTLSFESDPSNPVPTIGGRNLFLAHGPKDQRPIEQRSDVLVFTTSPLEEELEVTGQMRVHLYLSSNTNDKDIAVRLTDVYPDGKSMLISDGLYHAGVMGGKALKNDAEMLQEIIVDLSATSLVFAKRHAIRLSIAGSNYPRYEKNRHPELCGDSETMAIARSQVHMGNKAASCLILPVVRQGNKWWAEGEKDSAISISNHDKEKESL